MTSSEGQTGARAGSRRERREMRTIAVMTGMYCRAHHAQAGRAEPGGTAGPARALLCRECSALLDYSLLRVSSCSYGRRKPTCARCTVHCFRPGIREQVKTVMRYSGPRMSYRHPYLAMRHLLDRRKGPDEIR
jgi:hypothetical protein